MRPRRSPGAWALALACVASARAGFAAGFDVAAQDRGVAVAITVYTVQCLPGGGCSEIEPPVNYADSTSAPDFAAFAATASVPAFSDFSASQTSSLEATSIRAQGSGLHTGSGAYFGPYGFAHETTGTSDSHFEVSFDVDAPTPYRLNGSVSAAIMSPFVCCTYHQASSTARIRLRTAIGTTLAEVVAFADPACNQESCMTVGPSGLYRGGVLAPGSYVLEASTAGSAFPNYFAHQWTTEASTGAYQVELLLLDDVPALGPGGLALLALALGLAAASLLARARA